VGQHLRLARTACVLAVIIVGHLFLMTGNAQAFGCVETTGPGQATTMHVPSGVGELVSGCPDDRITCPALTATATPEQNNAPTHAPRSELPLGTARAAAAPPPGLGVGPALLLPLRLQARRALLQVYRL
jgi:hypothetical protein